jgi:hypothetical protein
MNFFVCDVGDVKTHERGKTSEDFWWEGSTGNGNIIVGEIKKSELCHASECVAGNYLYMLVTQIE